MNMKIDLAKMSALYSASDNANKSNLQTQSKKGFSQVLEGALKSKPDTNCESSGKTKQMLNGANRLERLLVQTNQVAGREQEAVTNKQSESGSDQELAEQPWIQVVLNLLFALADQQTTSNKEQTNSSEGNPLIDSTTTLSQDLAALQAMVTSAATGVVEQTQFDAAAAGPQMLTPESLDSILQALQSLDSPQLTAEVLPASIGPAPVISPEVPSLTAQPTNVDVQDAVTADNADLQSTKTEVSKMSGQLKSIMEQMLQGKVTIAGAAEAIVNQPGMLEQLGVLAKLIQTQLSPQKQHPNDVDTVSDQAAIQSPTTEPEAIPVLAVSNDSTTSQAEVTVNPSGVQAGGQEQQSSELNTQQANSEKLQPTAEAADDAQKISTSEKGSDDPDSIGEDFVESKAKVKSAKSLNMETKLENAPAQQNLDLMSNTDNLLDNHPQMMSSDLLVNDQLGRGEKTKVETTARQLATHLIYKQIVDQSAMLVNGEHSEVRIHLRPEFLGKLSLEIAVEQGVVKAEIIAENQQVRQLIEANLGNLKQTLTNQGLKVEHLVVNLGQGQAQSGQAKEQSSSFTRQTRKTRNNNESFEIAEISAEYGGHLTTDQQLVDYKV